MRRKPMADTRAQPAITRSQVIGVTLGNALEFYDFLVFTFFALQIGQTFFPNGNKTTSLLAALATFGAGFVTRPLGAMVIGRLSDRIGRKPMLILSFALVGVASLGVAATPSFASIGIAAPLIVILCRLVQGFALGGEVGSSTALLAEAAPPAQRGLYISLQYVSAFMAVLVAGGIGVALAAAMNEAALSAWGWRLAMGVGVLIVPIGLMLRGTLPETLDERVSAQAAPPLRSYARLATVAFFILLSGTITTYVLTFMTTYARTTLAMSPTAAFGATVVVGVSGMASALIAGVASDRLGRKPVMVWSMAISTATILPSFWLIVHWRSTAVFYVVVFLLRFGTHVAATAGLINVTEAFPPRVRSGALAVVYAMAISVFGGTTQFIIAWLVAATGDPLAPAWYMFAAALIGLAAMVLTRETAPLAIERGASPLL